MRPIQEIYKELLNHPDCIDARYFSIKDEWEDFVESITDDADAYEKFDLKEIEKHYFEDGHNVLFKAIQDRIEHGWEYTDPLSWVLTENLIEKGYLKPKE
jgi:hypothetical protein